MIRLLEEAVKVQDFFEAQDWRFCFIGGLAVQHWGEQRITRDIDVTLLTGFGGENAFLDTLLGKYGSRLPNARDFAQENRVLLLQTEGGTGIDISLAGLPFEESVVGRAQTIDFLPGCSVRICSAEDLIVMKAFADRPIDWQDVRGIVVRQGIDALDWDYVFHHLEPLAEAKEKPELCDQLRRLKTNLP